MSHRDFSQIPVMRKPDENGGIQLKRLKAIIEEKYGKKFNNYCEFHKWTIENLAEFWTEFWDFVGVIFSKKFDQVIDLSVPMADSPEWFRGSRLNFAENLLKYRDNRVALILAGEDKETKEITFAEMYKEACLYTAAFRKFGIKKGDIVACYTSNREEPMFAMHATTSIGAIWTGALPLLGAQAVLNRLKQVNPKILLTIDRFSNNRQEIDMLSKIKEIVDNLPSVEKVLIIPSKADSKLRDISNIRNSCFLDDFLKLGVDETGSVPEIEFEQVSFSHPVFINFTSGTTGLPKAMIHGCGALMPTAKDFWLQLDCTRDNTWFSMSPVGWVSWNMCCALSFAGISLLLFEGVPYFLSPTYFWDIVEKHKITDLFLPANISDDLEKYGYLPRKEHTLKHLKNCTAGGSIVKPRAYDFFYNTIKKDILFGSTYGCTEIVGMCLFVDPTVPVYRGETPIPTLGMDIQCVDESGKPVEGEYGELIVAKPSPVLLLGLWGDEDGSLRRKSYYSKYSGKFSIGDFAVVNPITKGFVICGRSDDTLKQRGTRFGSSEIYNVVVLFSEVCDSLCVSQYNKEMDERAVLFLKMKEGHNFNDNLVRRIRQEIAKELTPEHIPDVIIQTKDIPYSMNGKKMEIIVKNIINRRPYHPDNVYNSECLKYTRNSCERNTLRTKERTKREQNKSVAIERQVFATRTTHDEKRNHSSKFIRRVTSETDSILFVRVLNKFISAELFGLPYYL
ncbi:acetoacetyl-CoA synthetase [Caerostris darwini]|uniref:Acetoacetyl-CoA synthetase n=1 Tax=Caerostris darwini TaxID=1538125 RepID=A0AAV4S3M9_9ARAC|nr:acetoacetyl-CoA synthetase [Caerostris darwini]